LGHTGNTCGAVTGALMVIGMKYGRIIPEDFVAEEKTYALVQKFMSEFLRRNFSLNSIDLIGCNLADPKQLALG
jgi:C_GCAxxG_C_C family probable redox protein